MTTVLAVDVGGTKTAIARVDAQGRLSHHRTLPSARTLDETVTAIASTSGDVAAVGVIVPGIYTPDTGYAWCPNLWGTGEVPLREALLGALRTKVVIDSDRSGYVLGETWLGVARGLRHVVFVSIGTGIGVGILADGALLRGARGIAGAAGWFALDAEWKDVYRTTGCWEAEAAGPAVARAAGATDAQPVVTAARSGDGSACQILDRATRYTGMGVANLVSAFNPEMVVLGGGLIEGAGDVMLDRIRAEVTRWAQPIASAHCRIELSALGGRAGLFGAARLALDTCRGGAI